MTLMRISSAEAMSALQRALQYVRQCLPPARTFSVPLKFGRIETRKHQFNTGSILMIFSVCPESKCIFYALPPSQLGSV